MARSNDRTELVQGTLDMLVLRTLRSGPLHGYAIANKIQEESEGILRVEEGSLYPALHRMERRGWIAAEWGLSDIRRKAKYYELTASGREQLKAKAKTWSQLVEAIGGRHGNSNCEGVSDGRCCNPSLLICQRPTRARFARSTRKSATSSSSIWRCVRRTTFVAAWRPARRGNPPRSDSATLIAFGGLVGGHNWGNESCTSDCKSD